LEQSTAERTVQKEGRLMTSKKKKRRVRHLNEVPAKVHLRAGILKVIVEIPWTDLERRLSTTLPTGKFRRKRSAKK
jgi:hypothetical protein